MPKMRAIDTNDSSSVTPITVSSAISDAMPHPDCDDDRGDPDDEQQDPRPDATVGSKPTWRKRSVPVSSRR